ncbi:MAG: hypothetical protein PHG95_02515 [Patescibacteria group bacterium]|nr:hypothetical protein [Patescibacteria group bacterium]
MNIEKEEFNKLKIEVESRYKAIGSIFSPALEASIFFNANGWHHLRYDNNRSERSKAVQKNKLIFLNDALRVLRQATTIQEYRRTLLLDNNNNPHITEWFAFWAIVSFMRKIRIKIIIRRVGGNNSFYHFWSVMPYWSLRGREKLIASSKIEDE